MGDVQAGLFGVIGGHVVGLVAVLTAVFVDLLEEAGA